MSRQVFWEGAIFTANFLFLVYNILTVWALRGCIFYQFDNYVKNQRCGLKSLIKVHFLAYKKAETTDSKKLNPFSFLVLEEIELKAFHVVRSILPQNYIVPILSTGLIAHYANIRQNNKFSFYFPIQFVRETINYLAKVKQHSPLNQQPYLIQTTSASLPWEKS